MSRKWHEIELIKPKHAESSWSVHQYSEEKRNLPIVFPDRCVLCPKPRAGFHEFGAEKTSIAPGSNLTRKIAMPFPFCAEHLAIIEKGGQHSKFAAPKSKVSGLFKTLRRLSLAVVVLAILLFLLSSGGFAWISIGSSKDWIWDVVYVSLGLTLLLTLAKYLYGLWYIQNWTKTTPEGKAEKARYELYRSVWRNFAVQPKGDGILMGFTDADFAEEFRRLNKNIILG